MVEALIALTALTLMEIVLGIDNIVFISILTAKLPVAQQSIGRRLGLILALVSRLILLSLIFWIAQLTAPVIDLTRWLPMEPLKSHFMISEEPSGFGHAPPPAESESGDATQVSEPRFDQYAWNEFTGVSWRDLIMIAGGLFLIVNSVREIHHEVDGGQDEHGVSRRRPPTFYGVLTQIAVMDVVFSLDSVITAVGMANQLWVMFVAVILAVAVMILFANQVGSFVDSNPTIRMLALNFLLLIGVMLFAEGIGTPISKGYIYFAMAFSLMVEFFNNRIRRRQVSTGHAPIPSA